MTEKKFTEKILEKKNKKLFHYKMDLDLLLSNVKHFFVNLFACFTKKDTKYQSSTNDCSRYDDLETTYLFEIDDNVNYR